MTRRTPASSPCEPKEVSCTHNTVVYYVRMQITPPPPDAALRELGLTETEALAYCQLVRSGATTGYRLAKDLAKAAPNVYAALDSLARRGAVLADGAEPKTYRAVPPAELLAQLQREFEAKRHAAEAALRRVLPETPDDRVYRLKSLSQAYAKAEALIASAGSILLFDLGSGPFAQLRAALDAAARRGCTVAGLAYAAHPPVAFRTIVAPEAEAIQARWPGDQLTIVADGAAYLVALVASNGGELRHGVWSDSAYLSCLQHSGLAAEIRLSAAPAPDDPNADLALTRSFPKGLRQLIGPEPLSNP